VSAPTLVVEWKFVGFSFTCGLVISSVHCMSPCAGRLWFLAGENLPFEIGEG